VESPRDYVPIMLALEHYGLDERMRLVSDTQYRGPCPLHNGDNQDAFVIRLDTNRWTCYTHCGRGTVIDLVMSLEQCNVSKATRILNKIAREHRLEPAEIRGASRTTDEPPKPTGIKLPRNTRATQYAQSRGVSFKTAEHFGMGIVSSGTLAGRLILPLHWEDGTIIGYAHRDIVSQPPGRWQNRKGVPRFAMLFNLHRVARGGPIIVTEGYLDCIKVWQAGYRNVVATMGSKVTSTQAAKLSAWSSGAAILFDGDKAGYDGSAELANQLSVPSQIVALAEGDPAAHEDGVPRTDEEVRSLLSRVGLKKEDYQ